MVVFWLPKYSAISDARFLSPSSNPPPPHPTTQKKTKNKKLQILHSFLGFFTSSKTLSTLAETSMVDLPGH